MTALLLLLAACSDGEVEGPAASRLWSKGRITDVHGIIYSTADSPAEGSWTLPLDGPAVLSTWLTVEEGYNPGLGYAVDVNGVRAVEGFGIQPGQHLAVPVEPGPEGTVTLSVTGQEGVAFGAPELYRPEAKPRRVVLVMVDALQATHLGAWGYDRPTSPALDAIAAEGARWSWCYAPAPWTLPSSRALLTGLPPYRFGEGPLLAQRLGDAGWATAAITRNPWLGPDNGLSEGFSRHDLRGPIDAVDSTKRAIAWLTENRDRSAFLFLHHMDPHAPYGQQDPVPDDLAAAPVDRPGLTDERRRTIADYDADIRHTDEAIGQLWDALQGLDGESLLVVTADHGEEMWEHGGVEHGHSLYVELLRVPLVMAGDGVTTGRVIDEPASLLDVNTTILAWAGLEAEGRDLLAEQVPPMEPMLIAEAINHGEAVGLVYENQRYWLRNGIEHLYTADDPRDEDNRAQRADTSAWRRRLEEMFHLSVRAGGVVLLPRSARRVQPPIHRVDVDWGVKARQVRQARGDNYRRNEDVKVEADGTRTILRVPEGGSGSLVVELETTAEGPVTVVLNGARSAKTNPQTRSQRAIFFDDTRVPIRVRSGPVVWPLRGAPEPSELTVPDSDIEALRALGYLEGP